MGLCDSRTGRSTGIAHPEFTKGQIDESPFWGKFSENFSRRWQGEMVVLEEDGSTRV
jgi:hypothetical protein